MTDPVDPIADALAAEPDLGWLAQLTLQGWRWLTPVSDDQGVTLIHAIRAWPEGSCDALRIHSATNAEATRTNLDGDVVWTRTGTMMDLVAAAGELPPPTDPHAPHLVLRRIPQ